MSKYVARFLLVLIAAAVLVGVYLPRVHVSSRAWPIETHHPHLLAFLAVVVCWGAACVAVIAAFVIVVLNLWDYAELRSRGRM